MRSSPESGQRLTYGQPDRFMTGRQARKQAQDALRSARRCNSSPWSRCSADVPLAPERIA